MAVIRWDNYVDDSTITLGGGHSEILSRNNLKTRQIGDITRIDTTLNSPLLNLNFRFDLGSAKDTNLVCILNHNMQGLAGFVLFGTTPGGQDVGVEAFTLWAGSTYDAPNEMLYFSTTYTARYVTVQFNTPNQICDIGRIWFDDAWSYNNLMDFNIGVIDRSTKSKSRGGSTYSSSRQKLRKLDIVARGRSDADFIGTSADFDSFLTMDLAVGESGEIVCLPLTDTEHNRNRMGVYGTIVNNNPIRVLDKGADGFISEKRFSIEEDKG